MAFNSSNQISFLILDSLSNGSKYGLEIIEFISQKTGGNYILKKPTLYSCLTRMEKKGFVYRVAMGASRYRAKLLLTEKGRSAARHIRERAALAVARSGAGLSDEERQVFYRALEQITENMQALCKEGLPEQLP